MTVFPPICQNQRVALRSFRYTAPESGMVSQMNKEWLSSILSLGGRHMLGLALYVSKCLFCSILV